MALRGTSYGSLRGPSPSTPSTYAPLSNPKRASPDAPASKSLSASPPKTRLTTTSLRPSCGCNGNCPSHPARSPTISPPTSKAAR
eukprot:12632869-Heterocapsa_arctica.AAC.1